MRRIQACEADHRHPQGPGGGAEVGGQLGRAERKAAVIVANRLSDQERGPGQPPAEVRQVGLAELVHRRDPYGVQAGAVEHDAQRLGLAVADDQHDGVVVGRLLETIEGREVPDTRVEVRFCHTRCLPR